MNIRDTLPSHKNDKGVGSNQSGEQIQESICEHDQFINIQDQNNPEEEVVASPA